MKRLLPLIITVMALQSCSLLRMGYGYGYNDYNIPAYDQYNSTYGYDTPVSPINIAVNIDRQPAWGPAGYDCAAFYYMPALNVYYDVNASLFYYPSGASWIASQYLPHSYRNRDLYRTFKVVLNYSSPWQHNDHHRSQFRQYRNNHSQVTISKSRDPRYNRSRDNIRPWVDPNSHNNPNNHRPNHKPHHR